MKNNILITSSSSVLIAVLIFSDGRNPVAVVNGYNIDKVASGCGKRLDQTATMRMQALHSIDSAIAEVIAGRPNTCTCMASSPIYAAANCSRQLTDPDDCKNCLYNAQWRAVDAECPHQFGGWLALKDCYVRYDISKESCEM